MKPLIHDYNLLSNKLRFLPSFLTNTKNQPVLNTPSAINSNKKLIPSWNTYWYDLDKATNYCCRNLISGIYQYHVVLPIKLLAVKNKNDYEKIIFDENILLFKTKSNINGEMYYTLLIESDNECWSADINVNDIIPKHYFKEHYFSITHNQHQMLTKLKTNGYFSNSVNVYENLIYSTVLSPITSSSTGVINRFNL